MRQSIGIEGISCSDKTHISLWELWVVVSSWINLPGESNSKHEKIDDKPCRFQLLICPSCWIMSPGSPGTPDPRWNANGSWLATFVEQILRMFQLLFQLCTFSIFFWPLIKVGMPFFPSKCRIVLVFFCFRGEVEIEMALGNKRMYKERSL